MRRCNHVLPLPPDNSALSYLKSTYFPVLPPFLPLSFSLGGIGPNDTSSLLRLKLTHVELSGGNTHRSVLDPPKGNATNPTGRVGIGSGFFTLGWSVWGGVV